MAFPQCRNADKASYIFSRARLAEPSGWWAVNGWAGRNDMTSSNVRENGALPYLALQPTTPLHAALPAGVPIIVDGGIEPAHFDTLRRADVELVVVGRTLFDAPDVAQGVRHLRRETEQALVVG